MNEKISVVVPVYNVEKYLSECIDSILKQTYRNFELLLIDDGSTDSSGVICERYKNSDFRIKVIHKENEGLGLTRNVGIDNANGEFVTFIDSDDFVTCDYLESLLTLLNDNHVDTSITSYYKYHSINSQTRVNKTSGIVTIKGNKSVIDFIPRLFGSLPNSIRDTFPMSATMTLFSMEIIKRYNIRFPSERQYICEDIIFDIEYLKHSNGLAISDYAGYYYRDSAGSLTTKYNPERFDKIKLLYKKEIELMSDMEKYDESLLRIKWQYFIHLRMLFKQEIDKNGFFSQKCMINSKKILNDEFVKSVIKDYPINKLDFARRIFLLCVKYKLVIPTLICVAIKN